MNKIECTEYLSHAGLRRVYVCRDDDKPLHSFNIPSRGCNFARLLGDRPQKSYSRLLLIR